MRKIFCDNHPDREAVATFRILRLPLGIRPLFIGFYDGGKLIDLCEECANHIALKEPDATTR